jgi:two-component system, LytTR family, response regulator
MTPLGAVIADDEPLARERIRTLLAAFPEVSVVGEARDGNEAAAKVRELRPSLLFLDVQMPEGDGFSVLERLPPEAIPAVIFVTAYDAFALRAFEVHAVDYLLKPFTRARFSRAMGHVLTKLSQPARSGIESEVLSLLEAIRAERRTKERVAIRTGEAVYFVRIADIEWLEAAGNYVKIHAGGQEHLLRDSLKSFEERLDPDRFLRVHRSAIVNVDSIQRLEPWFHGEYAVVLRDGRKLMSSRTYSERLRKIVQ